MLVLREELEEKGVARTDVEARVAAHRALLTAEVDAALAATASPSAATASR